MLGYSGSHIISKRNSSSSSTNSSRQQAIPVHEQRKRTGFNAQKLRTKNITKFDQLCQSLTYQFNNTNLLEEALTRHTAIIEKLATVPENDYQRLEFIGDRVLNFFILQILMQKFPNLTPEELNNLKIQCISNKGLLLEFAKAINLENYIIHGKGENSITEKMYADAMEAIFGAIYLDCNSNAQVLIKIINKLLQPHIEVLEAQVATLILQKNTTQTLSVCSTRTEQQYNAIIQHGQTHFDDGIFQFRKIVLNWSIEKIDDPLVSIKYSDPIPDSYPYGEFTRTLYYRNFRDLILEEARATLLNGIEDVLADKAQCFPLRVKKFRPAKNNENPSIFIMSGNLPKDFEHGTSNIGLLLEIKTKDTQKKYDFLLGLASYQESETAENIFEIKTVIPLGLKNDVYTATSPGTKWDVYALGSLVTHQRMYEACTKMPRTIFEEQLITGQLAKAEPDLASATNPSLDLIKALENLNISQSSAITKFLTAPNGISLLQGPPGTGKTSTIITLLEILYSRHARILVCAPSNKAVHVLAHRFLNKNPEAIMTLVGVSRKIPAELDPIFIDNFSKTINYQISQCLQLINQLLSDTALVFNTLTNVINKIITISAKISTSITRIAPPLYDTNAWGQVTTLAEQLLQPTADVKNLLALLFNTFTNIQGKIALIDVRTDQNSTSQIEIMILNHAQIIFSTLSTAGRRAIQEMREIDILIVDEASQAVEAETLIPFTLNPKKCLLVGDTKQLPATVLSQAATKLKFQRSLMWRLLEDCKQDYAMLTVQYRMHPAIRQWPSSQYYDNKLEDAEVIINQAQALIRNYPAILAPCSFVDIQATETACGSSYKNTQEAKYIISILAYLTQQGVNAKKQIGIITFYSAQVEHISNLLQRYPQYSDITVHTVDGFQGDERDFIIISFVRANPKGQVGFITDFRRLNVSITRARLGLIMLGNIETLEKKASDVAILIDNMRHRNLLWPEQQLRITLTKPTIHQITQHSTISTLILQQSKYVLLCNQLTYNFQNLEYLREALTRQSAIEEKLREAASNNCQKLLMLGDNLLKLAIAKFSIDTFSKANEAILHSIEMQLISTTETLSNVARVFNLEQYLIKGLGEKNITDNMLADSMKAIFGAMYLDSNDTQNINNIIIKLLIPYLQIVPALPPSISILETNEPQTVAAKLQPKLSVKQPHFFKAKSAFSTTPADHPTSRKLQINISYR